MAFVPEFYSLKGTLNHNKEEDGYSKIRQMETLEFCCFTLEEHVLDCTISLALLV